MWSDMTTDFFVVEDDDDDHTAIALSYKRDGFCGYDTCLRSGGHNCFPSGQNLLQRRAICSFIRLTISLGMVRLLMGIFLARVRLSLMSRGTDGDGIVGFLLLMKRWWLKRFHLTLVVTAVVCSWMMWAIVYIAQMKPLIVPILSEGE
ncbi:hypothetical protein FNV43_RR07910 [Rhamnella rubrinervis]|uniref:Uncharacterized protein n=1 Tax=Rhamnella rubrinervis TaxID=2594499 RepID=A0A8K0HHH3_9ROSA|nr:hypothetical protein FNV43_RR07910 [Rhamnella rubrinervis]